MRDFIIINGVNSNDIQGLLIQSLPPITKPPMNTEISTVEGRNGDTIFPLGYSSYDKSILIGLYGNYNLDDVYDFFAYEGTIIFSNEPDKYYQYTLTAQIDYEKLRHFKQATVTIHVQPCKYAVSDITREVTAATIEVSGKKCSFYGDGSQLKTIALQGDTMQTETPKASEIFNTIHPISCVTGRNIISTIQNDKEYSVPIDLGVTDLRKVDGAVDTIANISDSTYKLYNNSGMVQIEFDPSLIYEYFEQYYDSETCSFVLNKPSDFIGRGNTNYHEIISDRVEMGQPGDVDKSYKMYVTDSTDKIYIYLPKEETLDYYVGRLAALNGAKFIYRLKDTEEIEITDTNLIEQLARASRLSTFVGENILTTKAYSGAKPTLGAIIYKTAIQFANLGNYYVRPTIQITGNKTIEIYADHVPVLVWYGPDDTANITIDTDNMEAYDGDILLNRQVSGDYNKIKLQRGEHIISFRGNVITASVTNVSRWI